MSVSKTLPIGTVVRIKGEDEVDFMIIGSLAHMPDGTMKDYIIVVHPFGVIDPNDVLMCNAEDIGEIIHEGYRSERYENYEKMHAAILI